MATQQLSVRATIVELWKRFTPLVKDKDKEVYHNGYNNLYPSEVERVIAGSPTASRAARLMGKFIAGAGVLGADGKVAKYSDLPFVNEKKAYKITDVIRIASQVTAKQNGVFYHVSFGLDDSAKIVPTGIDVLEYSYCRITKEDDNDNPGMILYKDFESGKSVFGKDTSKRFYPFNPSQAVLLEQIKADARKKNITDLEEAIKHYTGQVYYMNLTPEYRYALSLFDSVFNDSDTEGRVSIHTNSEVRNGFLGKVITLTQGLDPEMAEKVKKDLQSFLGAENSASMYHMDVAHSSGLDDVLKVIQLKAQFDDKLFEVTDKRIRRNIMGAANNIPEAMISASDSALFGTNADTYKEMKIFYSEQTEEEREKIQETLTYLGFPCVIEPIAKRDATVVNDEQAKAQAALKGSVGGVTALIELQTAVSQGLATRNAAIQIIETIYGIDRGTAEVMIGDPIEVPLTE